MDPIIYGPLTLPSGKVISFRRPRGLDRSNVMQMVPLDINNPIGASIMIDSYIQAKVVTAVDGKPVDGTGYKTLFNEWDDSDIQYYQAVYSEMFGMNEEKQADAKEKAAFLLKSSTFTDGSNSPNPAPAP